MEVMEEQIYRQILRMRALDRWENEGGSVDPHQRAMATGSSTEQRSVGNNTTQDSQVQEKTDHIGRQEGTI